MTSHGHGPESLDAPDRHDWQRPAAVVAAMEIEPGATVADVGAGTGYFLPYLSKAVGAAGAVLAVEIAAERLEAIRQRIEKEQLANVSARAVSPDDPGLDVESVDRILLVNTWHHVHDRVACAVRLRAALRPGGAVYIVDVERTHSGAHDHHLTVARVLDELAAAGLDAARVDVTLPRQYMVRARRR